MDVSAVAPRGTMLEPAMLLPSAIIRCCCDFFRVSRQRKKFGGYGFVNSSAAASVLLGNVEALIQRIWIQ